MRQRTLAATDAQTLMVRFRLIFACVVLMILTLALQGVAQITSAPAAGQARHAEAGAGMMMMPARAIAVVYPASGSQVHGTVSFEKVEGGVHVVADIQGLTPGQHGFHIHEYGDCTSADAASAGGHFNPGHMSHGAPTDMSRHEGDMGNISAGPDGKAHLEWSDPKMSFMGQESIIGLSVIIHANPDDLKTQPSGNAGPRVACGVIGIAK
jgi:Cu-Zn family superoxide dismutase